MAEIEVSIGIALYYADLDVPSGNTVVRCFQPVLNNKVF